MGRPDPVLSIHAFLRLLLHLWRRTRFLTRPRLAHHFRLWLVSSGWRSSFIHISSFRASTAFTSSSSGTVWQSAHGLPAMVVKMFSPVKFWLTDTHVFFFYFWKRVVNTQVPVMSWIYKWQTNLMNFCLIFSSSLKKGKKTPVNMENMWKRLQSVKDESSQRLSCKVRGQHSCTQTVKRWIYDKNHFLFGFNY